LKEYGFTQISADSSVFTLKREMDSPTGKRKETLHLGAYVGDLCVICDNDDKYTPSISTLSPHSRRGGRSRTRATCTTCSGLNSGSVAQASGDTVTLHQQTYIEKLSADFLPDGVPPQFQANKPPCDHNLPLHVVEAMSQQCPRSRFRTSTPILRIDPASLTL
jgi:hypothetical protein